VTRFDHHRSDFRIQAGGAPAAPPGVNEFWAAKTVGTGAHTLSWAPQNGSWRIVVMNADGSPRVRARVAVGARFPDLIWIGLGVLGGGLLLLVAGGGAIYGGVGRAS
jgi:hypothetical protein